MPDTFKKELLRKLWAKMETAGGTPSLPQSVSKILALSSCAETPPFVFSSAILEDYTLTQQVLRLANSAMYSVFGGNVSTVTQAVTIIGQTTVGHLAVRLRLLDSLKKEGQTPEFELALLHTVMAGNFAQDLANKCIDGASEEAVVCAMLHNTGKLITLCHLPELWEKVQVLTGGGVPEQDAILKVMSGLSFEDIGREAANKWNLPSKIVNSLGDATVLNETPGSHEDWLRAISCASNEIASVLSSGNSMDDAVPDLAAKYAGMLGLSPNDIVESVANVMADNKVTTHVTSLESIHKGIIARKPDNAQAKLRSGMAGFTKLGDSSSFPNMLGAVTELLHSSFGFQRTLAFTLDAKIKQFKARVGFGSSIAGQIPDLTFEAEYAPDVFHVALATRKPVFIADAKIATTAERLPFWYRDLAPDSGSFLLVPLVFNNKAIGLLYGDWKLAGEHTTISIEDLALVSKLCDMLMASLQPKKS